jgi:hypothetical protein
MVTGEREVLVSLEGNFHRKQFDLIAISKRYQGVQLQIGCSEQADFVFATELGFDTDIKCSDKLIDLDDKLFFKLFCQENKLRTLDWCSGVSDMTGDVMLKPRRGSGSVGLSEHRISIGEEIDENFIAERFISGYRTYGVGIYAKDNFCKYSCYWTRQKTFPREGGPSTVAKKVKCHELEEFIQPFLEALKRTKNLEGLFMLECIRDKNGFYFLECNPRPWGSIAFLEAQNPGFWTEFCLDQFSVAVIPIAPQISFKYFVNPIFEPSMILRSNCFYSGFEAGPLMALRYLRLLVSLESLVKLVKKLWR